MTRLRAYPRAVQGNLGQPEDQHCRQATRSSVANLTQKAVRLLKATKQKAAQAVETARPYVERAEKIATSTGRAIQSGAAKAEKFGQRVERGRRKAERIHRRISMKAARYQPNIGGVMGGIQPGISLEIKPGMTLLPEKRKKPKNPFEF